MFTKVLLRSENPCFFLKEVNPFQGDWLWRFTLVLFSWQIMTLKIMWGIFCLGSGGCLAVDTVVAVLVRPVLAMHSPVSPHRQELQKIIPQSDKWPKWNDHFYISRIQRKRFLLFHALMHHLYHRVPHWALSGPPGVDGDTQQAGLGQVSKVKTANWIIKLHPIAKRSQLSSQNTHCPSKELVFMAFCH